MSVMGAEVIAEVRKIAKRDPKFVYGEDTGGSCSYFGRGIGDPVGQRCLIGQALVNLEVDMTKVLEVENSLSPDVMGSEIKYLIEGEVVDIVANPSEVSWLTEVQKKQDRGFPWSEAVKLADETANWKRLFG